MNSSIARYHFLFHSLTDWIRTEISGIFSRLQQPVVAEAVFFNWLIEPNIEYTELVLCIHVSSDMHLSTDMIVAHRAPNSRRQLCLSRCVQTVSFERFVRITYHIWPPTITLRCETWLIGEKYFPPEFERHIAVLERKFESFTLIYLSNGRFLSR